MSIDRRLRDGFVSAGPVPDDVDVEHHLRRAVARAHRRELGRAVAVGVVGVSLVLGAFAIGAAVRERHGSLPLGPGPTPTVDTGSVAGATTPLDGRYVSTVRVADGIAAGLSRSDAYGVSGRMDLWLARDTVRMEQHLRAINGIPVLGTVEVRGHLVVIAEDGEQLTLAWRRLAGGDLRFTIVDDTRTGDDRRVDEVLWTSHDWNLTSV